MSSHKSAIIYCRFSPRPNAKECESNKHQRTRCNNYCIFRKYDVIHTFEDIAVSGKTIDRPQLTAAISALQPGMVLIVDTRDRLARDMLVSLTIHQQVKERGATIEIADGSPSRETPEGNLMANILDAFAQYDRERFARRTKAGLARKRKDGVYLGKPPIGWRLDEATKRLVADDGEQRVIKDVLYRSGLGATSEEITGYVTSLWGTCRGKPWSARTIRRIIAREKENS